jgi:hypothetical protein
MRGKFCEKCFILIMAMSHAFYLFGDARTVYVAILLVFVSILACCSALCLFEKHMLALVALIHALPTRGRYVHQFI